LFSPELLVLNSLYKPTGSFSAKHCYVLNTVHAMKDIGYIDLKQIFPV